MHGEMVFCLLVCLFVVCLYVSLYLGLGIAFHDFNDDVDSCALLAGFCLRIRGSWCGLVTNHETGGRLQCEHICRDV